MHGDSSEIKFPEHFLKLSSNVPFQELFRKTKYNG